MEPQRIEPKLAAILSADVKGYSRLMGADEEGTLRTLTAYREEMDAIIRQHRGRVVGSAGDSVLAEFASVVDAMQCAVVIQATLKAENASLPAQRKMEFRIGINLGDVMVQGEQIYGDGVNIAARLESLAEPGGIYISSTVYDQVKNKLALEYEYLGEQEVKNIAEPVRVYRVREPESAAPTTSASVLRQAQHERISTPRTLSLSKGAHPSRAVLLLAGLLLIVGAAATIRYFSSSTIRTPQSPIPNQEALPLPDRPSIAVLPFVNISEDPKQEYFSDGLTEDLITDLSKLPGLFVIARNSVFTYKGKAVKVAEVGRELGVRYVLEGSVRKAEDRVRINTQLVDATTGHHLWSERYDRELKDIFALQDEIIQQIVVNLNVEIRQAELARVRRTPTNNLTAYDYLLRGMELLQRFTKETNAQARQMFEKALELDPQYAEAYAALGLTYHLELVWQWSQDPQTLERWFALAQRALALDDSLPLAHSLLGQAYLWKRQYEQAIAEGERAIALNPNDAGGYSWLADTLNFTGQPEEALGLAEKAMRLDPRNRDVYLFEVGWAYNWLGRYKEAITALKRVLTRHPNHLGAHATLVVSYSELGREEEARAEAAEVLRISPNFSLESVRQRGPYKDQARLERWLDAWRKAGLK